MRSVRCDICGQNHSRIAGYRCQGEAEPAANENTPWDEKGWRRDYMREYMRDYRAKRKVAAKANP